jgi:hypothetical protein
MPESYRPTSSPSTLGAPQASSTAVVEACSDHVSSQPDRLGPQSIFHSDRHEQEGLVSVFQSRNMLLAFAILLIGALRPATMAVLLQYMPINFGWKMSQVALLISEVAIVNIVLYLFVMPQAITWTASQWQLQSQVIDWFIVFASLLLLALGTLCIGLAPSVQFLIPCKCPLKIIIASLQKLSMASI